MSKSFRHVSENAKMEALYIAAEKLPLGKKRDELLSKATTAEVLAEMELWINSPGLRAPD